MAQAYLLANHFHLLEVKVRGDKAAERMTKILNHRKYGGKYSVSSKEWIRDGVKLEKVKLHINWLLLLGAGGLSEEEIQVQINLWVGVRFPSGQPLPLPSRLRVGYLDAKTNRDTCRTLMNKGMGIFLEVTFSNSCHTPRPLFPVFQSCSPKLTDQRGAVGSSQDVAGCDG